MAEHTPGKATTCHVCGAVVPWKDAKFPKLGGWDACPMHKAAPDLLAALVDAMIDGHMNGCLQGARGKAPNDLCSPLCHKFRAAIAKARGTEGA